jgi:ribosomal protein S18 acetylase RimI-like enzyme
MPEERPDAQVHIRAYEPSDLERVRWLFARTPPWGRTYSRPQPLPEDLEDPEGSYPGGCFVALEQDMGGEAVIGFTAVATVDATAREDLPPFIDRRVAMARIHWVSVAPERWRLGVGRRLTAASIDRAISRGAEAIVLETSSAQRGAIALYESMGFVEAGRTQVGPWRQVWLVLPAARHDGLRRGG